MKTQEVSVSEAEIRVWNAIARGHVWMTSKEIAVAANVADRTSREFLLRFAEVGVVERAKISSGYRYRLDTRAERSYFDRLRRGARILGLGDPLGKTFSDRD
jgi:predicted transcriptional regulator